MNNDLINITDKTKSLRQEFIKGELLILDNKYHVVCVSQTPQKLFTNIHSVDDKNKNTWEVMTNRLKSFPEIKKE